MTVSDDAGHQIMSESVSDDGRDLGWAKQFKMVDLLAIVYSATTTVGGMYIL